MLSSDHSNLPSQSDQPKKWSYLMSEIYIGGKPPVLGTVDIAKLEQKAREKLKDHIEAFNYTFGSAGTCSTELANRKAFDKWKIIPRMLVDANTRSIETTIFGVKYPTPLLVAPIGVQGIVHADAELATARAAAKVGVPFILSTAASRSIEEVASANGNGHRWFQLYWPKSEDVTLSFLKRAKDNGFTALVVTLDTILLGWRPHDLDNAYLPFLSGVGNQVSTSDPVFMAKLGLQPIRNYHPPFPYEPKKVFQAYKDGDEHTKQQVFLGKESLGEINSGIFRTWEDVKFLRDNWDGPLVLKGILSVLDAEKAVDIGVNGIVVSNHGGRQIDGAIPSLFALDQICQSPKIKEAQRDKDFTVLFDSGVRTGSDVIKAVALGAQGILLGRPWVYGLAIGGEVGVEAVLRQTLADLEINLALSGNKCLDDVRGRREVVLAKSDWW